MFTAKGSGFVIPLDDEIAERLANKYFCDIEDLANDIGLGDMESIDNISDAHADYSGYDELVGDCGVWYIYCDENSGERFDYADVIREVSDLDPALYYFSNFEIELYD